MAIEIERKFLLAADDWRAAVTRVETMVQGYLAESPGCSVRVRVAGEDASLNLKGITIGASRSEFEYPLPLADGRFMLEHYCSGRTVEKRRHHLEYGGQHWEIDEFLGANAGLVVAEIELESEDQSFAQPQWLGAEVTGDARYYNLMLADRPYRSWADD
ncbi:MAG: CYTH domain-containing protein [Gammaproteobacteria bacterium]